MGEAETELLILWLVVLELLVGGWVVVTSLLPDYFLNVSALPT